MIAKVGLARKSDGTVWAWGRNAYGNLGDGSTTNRLTPVQVLGASGKGTLTGVAAVSAGGASVALKSDGTVWAWGDNSQGQVGDASTRVRKSPVQITSMTGVTAISAGRTHTMVLRSDKTVYAWGGNENGQLGYTTTATCSTLACSTSPGKVQGLIDVTAIAAGGLHNTGGFEGSSSFAISTQAAPTPPVPSTAVHVGDVLTTDSAGTPVTSFTRGGTVYWRVKVLAQDGHAVSGASVLTDLVLPSGAVLMSGSANSDSAGWAKFSYKTTKQSTVGTYTVRVTTLSLSGATYDSASNVKTSTTLQLK
jgi:hypothetical protein